MIDTYPAFDVSPVPVPGPDARAPEPFHGIYGMPMFVSVPSADLEASTDFWVRGLGFFELFSVPGQVVHLRRWTFQDVLLVPAGRPTEAAALSVSFSCVLDQVEGIASACEAALPGSTTGPRTMPWGSVEVEVVTPENARVVMTAARPYDPESPEAQNLREMGIEGPGE
ncbi:VOC family protein [Promicromonospora kroppenstedtii]|uniref:VOC family protein n=1 Tax=Promicromonospora kroppenstedtii TaxID=440482 RepID=UPI0004AE90D5|nr:VOC family protein [Promicromonospora kroppenstedtii]